MANYNVHEVESLENSLCEATKVYYAGFNCYLDARNFIEDLAGNYFADKYEPYFSDECVDSSKPRPSWMLQSTMTTTHVQEEVCEELPF